MPVDEVIQSILDAPQFAYLRKEVVILPGRTEPLVPSRKILLLEACGLTGARQARMEAEIKSNPILLDFIDPLDEFGTSRLYGDLAGVSFGDVPTLLEFMAMLPDDVKLWLEKAMEINPSQFSWINEMTEAIQKADAAYFASLGVVADKPDEEADKKEKAKKKPRQRKSANG